MTSIAEFIRERFVRAKPLPPGNYHYQSPPDEVPYRLHLRLQPNGSGVLIVNAATVLHLNPTAAEYAYHFIKGTSEEKVAEEVAARYHVNVDIVLRDFTDFRERIRTLIDVPDLDPVSYLDLKRVTPHSQELTTPLRLDCALTYRLPSGADKAAAPNKRVTRELTTEEWQAVLDKAWTAGVPHVTFTGGEPTLRDDLPLLIAHAEKNGQVCGLLSDGLKLANKKYLQSLLQTGLDHLLFMLQPEKQVSWDALETVMPEDLFTTVHITVTPKNAKKTNEILKKLASLKVKSLSISASDAALSETLTELSNIAAGLGLSLTFDLPVPYSTQNPIALETAEDNVPPGAGKAWLYVEPDGDVLPAQGMSDKVLGNILKDPWEKIYPS